MRIVKTAEAKKNEILFADEPKGALNRSASEEVLRTFLQINRTGTTILMVTHDSLVAARCQRILYLLDGEIQGELHLGPFAEAESSSRHQQTTEWLKKTGW